MTMLQFAIGALNDIVDAPGRRGPEASEADPRRSTSLQGWRGEWSPSRAGVGLLLAAPSGPARSFAVGVVVLAVGGAYDLFAKGTPWSWLPFAVGIPRCPCTAGSG